MTVQFFASLGTQWKQSAAGSLTGLDYQCVESAMNMSLIPKYKRKSLLSGIRTMESAVIEYMREKEE